MKSLAPHDRPREKLDRLGPAGLGDNELLAVILGHGVRASSAIDVANDVLQVVRGVHGLTRQSQGELRRLKGIGAVKASQILAAVELGRRTLLRAPERREQLGPHGMSRRISCRAMVRARSSNSGSCFSTRSTGC